jgi:hypothetical protein
MTLTAFHQVETGYYGVRLSRSDPERFRGRFHIDGREAVIPWADRRGYINFNFGAVSGDHGFLL